MKNGYQIMADVYASKGLSKRARMLELLANCDSEDINTLFDSTAFNEIVNGYVQEAVKELAIEGEITEEQGRAVRQKVRDLFESMSAAEIREGA